MELSLQLDTLGMVEVRYLRGRERFRDWPPFLLFAASRQARILAYLTREGLEQLHQQILAVEDATGLGVDDEEEDEEEENGVEETSENEGPREKGLEEAGPLSPAFAQALERLNELARQRLPDGGSGSGPAAEELARANEEALGEEEDVLEQLQDAFVQMMEVVRELAEELATDALKMIGRFRCARADVYFTQAEASADEESAEDMEDENGLMELALILRLFEEGRAKPDDMPAVELRLDVDDFERLHETIDLALERERRSRRRR